MGQLHKRNSLFIISHQLTASTCTHKQNGVKTISLWQKSKQQMNNLLPDLCYLQVCLQQLEELKGKRKTEQEFSHLNLTETLLPVSLRFL